MKKNKIRYLWALGLMLCMGQCKNKESPTPPPYCETTNYPCEPCEQAYCDKLLSKELEYDGYVPIRHGYQFYSKIAPWLLIACDTTFLIKTEMKVGVIYTVDYNIKEHCPVFGTGGGLPPVFYIDITNIKEK